MGENLAETLFVQWVRLGRARSFEAAQREETTMCNVFAGQDPNGYKTINRSVRIGGHSTSIQLESAFWDLLDEIASSQGLTTSKFMSTLYDEAVEKQGNIPNFASMLRTSCVLHLSGARPTKAEVLALHS